MKVAYFILVTIYLHQLLFEDGIDMADFGVGERLWCRHRFRSAQTIPLSRMAFVGVGWRARLARLVRWLSKCRRGGMLQGQRCDEVSCF